MRRASCSTTSATTEGDGGPGSSERRREAGAGVRVTDDGDTLLAKDAMVSFSGKVTVWSAALAVATGEAENSDTMVVTLFAVLDRAVVAA
jgi:hypothetical protein